MTLNELRKMAQESDRVSLVVPRPWRDKPKGFPRGELLCEQPTGNVISVCSKKLNTWLDKAEASVQQGGTQ